MGKMGTGTFLQEQKGASPQGASPQTANGTPERPLTVSQLAQGLDDVLKMCLADVWVVGQVSNFSRAASGHLYFDLKDAEAQVRCVMWRPEAARLRAAIEEGLEVLARGRMGFFGRGGRCQLYVSHLEPRGLGALEIKFRQLKERLEKEGLFAPERKKALPKFPATIGLVTSPVGAAIRDILKILSRRWPASRVLIYGVRVQGAGAAEEIAEAVGAFDKFLYGQVDVLIVGRGGGSVEDLWAFNEECVARAVAACRIPVVSAVGHETDFSISDFVADVRAATPSAAAEMVVPDRREVLRRVATEARRLQHGIRHTLSDARHRWLLAAQERCFKYPDELVTERAQVLDDLAAQLERLAAAAVDERRTQVHELLRRLVAVRPTARLAAQRGRLGIAAARFNSAGRSLAARSRATVEQFAQRLGALGPLAVLDRGYSITLSAATGRAVRAAGQVAEGELLETIVASRERIPSRVVARPDEGGTAHGEKRD